MKDIMLILHFIGLTMGLGTGFAHAFLGKVLTKLGGKEAAKFRNQIKSISHMGTVGTLLLLVSGLYLLIPYLPLITTLPLLILKLVLFIILVVLIFVINQVAKNNLKNNTENNSKRIGVMGQFTLILGVAIVIIAVNIFH